MSGPELVGILLGGAGLIVSGWAAWTAHVANRHAREATAEAQTANLLSAESNTLAKEAIQISRQVQEESRRVLLKVTAQIMRDIHGMPYLDVSVVNHGIDVQLARVLLVPQGGIHGDVVRPTILDRVRLEKGIELRAEHSERFAFRPGDLTQESVGGAQLCIRAAAITQTEHVFYSEDDEVKRWATTMVYDEWRALQQPPG